MSPGPCGFRSSPSSGFVMSPGPSGCGSGLGLRVRDVAGPRAFGLRASEGRSRPGRAASGRRPAGPRPRPGRRGPGPPSAWAVALPSAIALAAIGVAMRTRRAVRVVLFMVTPWFGGGWFRWEWSRPARPYGVFTEERRKDRLDVVGGRRSAGASSPCASSPRAARGEARARRDAATWSGVRSRRAGVRSLAVLQRTGRAGVTTSRKVAVTSPAPRRSARCHAVKTAARIGQQVQRGHARHQRRHCRPRPAIDTSARTRSACGSRPRRRGIPGGTSTPTSRVPGQRGVDGPTPAPCRWPRPTGPPGSPATSATISARARCKRLPSYVGARVVVRHDAGELRGARRDRVQGTAARLAQPSMGCSASRACGPGRRRPGPCASPRERVTAR